MESQPLEHFPTRKVGGRPYKNVLKEELYAYITELEQRRDFPLVFYWAVVNEFRSRTHSTRRIRKYLDELIGEGRLHSNMVWESNPLLSTQPFDSIGRN